MTGRLLTVLAVVCSWMAPPVAAGQEASGLSLSTAQPTRAVNVNATGRVRPMIVSRIGPRVAGHLAEFDKDPSGRMLDAGMSVQAGQVLFRLNETTFKNGLAISEAALNSAQAALANLTAKTRDERLEQLRQQVAELEIRLADRQREEQRFRRLVEEEKTLPGIRLEQVQTELGVVVSQLAAAKARLSEAQAGPTKTEIALAEARVKEVQAALKVAQDDLRDTVVKAPFAGLITRRLKGPGDYLTSVPPAEVLELVSADQLEAELRLPEAYYSAVQQGKTRVSLRSPLIKGQLKLPVTRVISDIDTAHGTFALRIAIPPEQKGGLISGAFVTAEIALDCADPCVIVPIRAVVQQQDKAFVMVPDKAKMARREVELGDRLSEGIVIKSGLTAGEKVVVGPASALKDGAALPEGLRQ